MVGTDPYKKELEEKQFSVLTPDSAHHVGDCSGQEPERHWLGRHSSGQRLQGMLAAEPAPPAGSSPLS